MVVSQQRSGMYKRIVSALLVAMLCLLPIFGLAADMGSVKTNNGGNLNLRQEPSDSATILASYPSGKWVEILEQGKTWHKVRVDGTVGYMAAKYVSLGKVTVVTDAKVSGANGYINLRASASADAKILAQYKNGTRVKILSHANGFYKVQAGDLVGYMVDYLVRLDDVKIETYAYVSTANGGNLNLRNAPSLEGRVLGSFANGTKVAVVQKDTTWSKVRASSATGYMMNKFLSFKKPAPPVTPDTFPKTPFAAKLINPNGNHIVNFRSAKNLANRYVICTYPVGTAVEVIEATTDWCKVSIDGTVGYISTWFMTW